jgi:putative tryptophan/tyrosine transport system substrate-binding protein
MRVYTLHLRHKTGSWEATLRNFENRIKLWSRVRLPIRTIFGVVAWLLLGASFAFSQGGPTPKKIGVLALSEADSIDALFASLRDLGWIDGKTIQIVFPKASPDPAVLEQNMGRLLDAHVDLIVTQTKLASLLAKRATRTVPIVMGAYDGDPVAEGIVKDLTHPGGNITGTYYNVAAIGAERIALLATLVPGMKSIGIIMNPKSDASIGQANDMVAKAHGRGLTAVTLPVLGGADVDAAFADAKTRGVDAITTIAGAEIFAIRKEIIAAQDKYRIPAVTGSIGYAEMGGLAKLGPDIPSLWRKMAPTIDKLLKGTATPADLPLVTLDSFEIDVNLHTAQSLGVNIPDDVRQRASRVYQ